MNQLNQLNKLNPIVTLATNGELSAIDCLVNTRQYSLNTGQYSLFDKINGLSGFDILVQYIIDSSFSQRAKLSQFISKHRQLYNVDVKTMFLMSPLVKEINISGKPFYIKIKNALKFLHKIDPINKLNYRTIGLMLYNAFGNFPKDAISLLRYVIKHNICNGVISNDDFNLLSFSSYKVCDWLLTHKTDQIDSDFYSKFFCYLFAGAYHDEIIEQNITKYLLIFSKFYIAFCDSMTESSLLEISSCYSERAVVAVNLYTSNTDRNSITKKFKILEKILSFFNDMFDFSISIHNCKNIIFSISDPLTKIRLTICLQIYKFNFEDQVQLFENLLLAAIELDDDKIIKMCVSLYFDIFPDLRNKYGEYMTDFAE